MLPTSLLLRLPAEPTNVRIARAFVGASLRTVGHPPSFIDDLRLAVSELMTVLVTQGGGMVELTLAIDDRAVTMSLAGPPVLPALPGEIRQLLGFFAEIQTEESEWLLRATPI
jgi:hypothetical protein